MKIFTASGVLYSSGDKIGVSDFIIADDYIPELVKKSLTSIPVVSDLGRLHDPMSLIGMGVLEYIPQKDDAPAHIRVHIKFNQDNQRVYEKALQESDHRKPLRFGFYINRIRHRSVDKQLRDGVISALALATDCLGGTVDRFGWEEKE